MMVDWEAVGSIQFSSTLTFLVPCLLIKGFVVYKDEIYFAIISKRKNTILVYYSAQWLSLRLSVKVSATR